MKQIYKSAHRELKLFHYNRKIDGQIKLAVEKVLHVSVKSASKMKHGEVNHVYKIITGHKNYLARVFRNKNWPSSGILPWIERQLIKHRIPHAKIVYYTRGNKFFPYGFMITEFLEGWNGPKAVDLRKISLTKAYQKIGAVLKKVHKIKVKKFGEINHGRGEWKNFLEHKLNEIKFRITTLEEDKAIPPGLFRVIKIKLEETLEPFKNKFFPVLNHGDANRDNAIFTKEGKWVLVDWDNAYFGIWLEDFTELTFWVDWARPQPQAKIRKKLITKNFFKGYGKTEYSLKEIAKMEVGLHIAKCTDMMIYYFYNKKSMTEFRKTKKKLLRLLK
jgi:aminoglycoside phosphotransferase (APT) family kinase protein